MRRARRNEDTFLPVRFRPPPSSRWGFFALVVAAFGSACLDWSSLENGSCGDKIIKQQETCDDGNRISGDGCSDTCSIEPDRCGDGRPAPNEDCDDGNGSNDDACLDSCKNASCGDGELFEFEEQCDDGNKQDGDGCSHDCKIEQAPPGPMCGDGKLDPDEACDDGNMDKSDACLNGCSWATCGDGVVRRGVEECDEGGAKGECSRGCMLCAGKAGSFYRGVNAHCYTLHGDPLPQDQARQACQAEGGDLWTVTSQAEGSDLIDKLMLSGRFWLGMTRNNGNNSWVTGEDSTYTSFAPGQPTGTERCIAFDTQATSGQWLSDACPASLPFVCERGNAFVYPLDHHAYLLHTGALGSAAAEQRCNADGGHLATLETDAERLFVGKNVGIAAWVGAGDEASEGHYVWSTGAELDTTRFAMGEPNDSGHMQNCMLLTPADKYNDNPCADARPYLCEFE